MDGDIAAIQTIVDNLRNEDVQVRVKSIRCIKDVAKSLGPERTREELLNFLNQLVGDEDIFLEALAEELGGFIELIGGPEHTSQLIEILESLCTAQDTKVREKAIQSCEIIVRSSPPEVISQTFFPFVQKLSSAEWFTAHISASFLYPTIYSSVSNEQKAELRSNFHKFVSNSLVAVRRAGAANLSKLITQVETENLMNDMLPLFKISSTDDQDSVRFLSVDSCISLAQKFSHPETVEHILPTIVALLQDSSWRVRYMAAEKIVNLASSLGDELTKSHLVDNFINLLKDSEAVVRAAAASRVTEFSEIVNNEEILLNKILPVVSVLVSDDAQQVRASLASNIMGMAPLLGKDKTISHLLNLFLTLLKDVFPEVRLNIISKLDAVNKVIGLKLLSESLLPAIIELAEDPKWRIRLAIINYVPLLATQLGPEFFNEQLVNFCLSWLNDPIYSIRETTISIVKRLIEIFGVAWGQENIFPRIVKLYESETFLSRMTSLFALNSLIPIVEKEVLTSTSFLPLIIRMASDPVPNIRFNVAQSLQLIASRVDANVVDNQIKPVLTTLLEDNDPDVKYYSYMALHAIGEKNNNNQN